MERLFLLISFHMSLAAALPYTVENHSSQDVNSSHVWLHTFLTPKFANKGNNQKLKNTSNQAAPPFMEPLYHVPDQNKTVTANTTSSNDSILQQDFPHSFSVTLVDPAVPHPQSTTRPQYTMTDARIYTTFLPCSGEEKYLTLTTPISYRQRHTMSDSEEQTIHKAPPVLPASASAKFSPPSRLTATQIFQLSTSGVNASNVLRPSILWPATFVQSRAGTPSLPFSLTRLQTKPIPSIHLSSQDAVADQYTIRETDTITRTDVSMLLPATSIREAVLAVAMASSRTVITSMVTSTVLLKTVLTTSEVQAISTSVKPGCTGVRCFLCHFYYCASALPLWKPLPIRHILRV